ncbi:MAG: hypothetical protein HWE22_06005 [Flavobacteriales bacterium]|nr:hypothetical protein [Flavobacteriales bacterium]
MKRRITGILLLFCLALPIPAMFTFLHYQKKQVRKDVKHQIIAGIDRSELVLLKFTKKECETTLRWNHAKEFEFDASMYDIVEAEVKDGLVHFWCWWDNKETKLNKQLDNLLLGAWNHNPLQRKNKERLTKLYKSLFFESDALLNPKIPVDTEQMNTSYDFGFLTRSYPPPVPPPEIC